MPCPPWRSLRGLRPDNAFGPTLACGQTRGPKAPGTVAVPGGAEGEEGLRGVNGMGFGRASRSRPFATHRHQSDP